MNNFIKRLLTGFLISYCATIFAETSPSSVNTTIIKTSLPAETTVTPNKSSQTTITTTSTTFPTNPKDDDIVSAVYAKYTKDPALIGTSLTVAAQNGIVTVSGTVTAQSQADEASIAAKSVAGVKDVRSTINVTTNPNLNKPAPKTNY